jgi:hypothetical protein
MKKGVLVTVTFAISTSDTEGTGPVETTVDVETTVGVDVALLVVTCGTKRTMPIAATVTKTTTAMAAAVFPIAAPW